MTRVLITVGLAVVSLLAAGCTSAPKATAHSQAQITGLPGLAMYYDQATADHHRAVRKPTRDLQARALRTLAQKTEVLLAETQTWDTDARLVGLAESERPAAQAAVADFRTTLTALRDSATAGNVKAVRATYNRALASYRHLNKTIGNLE